MIWLTQYWNNIRTTYRGTSVICWLRCNHAKWGARVHSSSVTWSTPREACGIVKLGTRITSNLGHLDFLWHIVDLMGIFEAIIWLMKKEKEEGGEWGNDRRVKLGVKPGNYFCWGFEGSFSLEIGLIFSRVNAVCKKTVM